MKPMKFEIIVDNSRAIEFLLRAIRDIFGIGDITKLEISKDEEEEE